MEGERWNWQHLKWLVGAFHPHCWIIMLMTTTVNEKKYMLIVLWAGVRCVRCQWTESVPFFVFFDTEQIPEKLKKNEKNERNTFLSLWPKNSFWEAKPKTIDMNVAPTPHQVLELNDRRQHSHTNNERNKRKETKLNVMLCPGSVYYTFERWSG